MFESLEDHKYKPLPNNRGRVSHTFQFGGKHLHSEVHASLCPNATWVALVYVYRESPRHQCTSRRAAIPEKKGFNTNKK